VAQRRAANGQLYLIDTKRPHSIFCPGRKKKNGAPARRQPKKSGDSPAVNPAIREAQAGLMSQGYKSRQVQGMLAELPAEILETADAETLIREVFKRRAAELAKKGAE
jgi:Holliday junction resolvasome RuvABC DNA-binding subunit